jgi:periplasmic copper chaperone A
MPMLFWRIPFVVVSLALCAPAWAGDAAPPPVTVSKAWARATPAGAKVGAAYLEIEVGAKADRLVSASTPAAGRAELHTHVHADGVMRMRRLDAVDLKAGESHAFAPGGDHIMLFELKEPLKEGGTLPLTLRFEHAGEVQVNATIAKIGAKSGPGASAEHTGHHKH